MPEIFFQDEEYCYIDDSGKNGFSAGDTVLYPDGGGQWQIGPSGNLKGVYNINKGYAVFKQIDRVEDIRCFFGCAYQRAFLLL